MPKISVIIPAYNAMTYLPETLDSVIAQTFKDFEVLVVDDGSTDDTPVYVASHTDSRVKLIAQSNQGTAAARNNGISQAKGEYVAFLDADDLWRKEKLEKQVQILDSRPEIGLVYTWLELIDHTGKSLNKVLASDVEGYVWKEMVTNCRISGGSQHLIRRKCFEEVGGFATDLHFAEDWEMLIRLSSRYHFAGVKEPLVLYRQHPNNKSKNCERMLKDFCEILDRSLSSKVGSDVEMLRTKGMARAHLYLAWKELENSDHIKANRYCLRSIEYDPQLAGTWDYWRLTIAILIMYLFGGTFYRKVREMKKMAT
jgi:glycosyltransferase involved in cell wall biosynthesis